MKIAFAGAGYIINIHAKAARVQKDVELTAVVEKYSDKSASLAQKFQIKNQYHTVEEMLKVGANDDVSQPQAVNVPEESKGHKQLGEFSADPQREPKERSVRPWRSD